MSIEALDAMVRSQELELQRQILAQEQSMTESKSRSDFCSLSAELRNRVYEFALIEDTIEFPRFLSPPLPRIPSILQSNRKVREEALPIYFANNIFEIEFHESFRSWDKEVRQPLARWLKAIGPVRCAQIKKLRVKHHYREGPLRPRMAMGGKNGAPTPRVTSQEQVYALLGLEDLGLSENQFVLDHSTMILANNTFKIDLGKDTPDYTATVKAPLTE
ncbi:Hypothetical predicted protein [Lecanosticta acicola]|uniref:Uncharacterized protein n=1 Tax=Lecanosticta acicola TaxID=111012 RepID=A0AAI9EE71_9PEZI|nr:Hypothetical predicted protein [Lecanosticta acicola]